MCMNQGEYKSNQNYYQARALGRQWYRLCKVYPGTIKKQCWELSRLELVGSAGFEPVDPPPNNSSLSVVQLSGASYEYS